MADQLACIWSLDGPAVLVLACLADWDGDGVEGGVLRVAAPGEEAERLGRVRERAENVERQPAGVVASASRWAAERCTSVSGGMWGWGRCIEASSEIMLVGESRGRIDYDVGRKQGPA